MAVMVEHPVSIEHPQGTPEFRELLQTLLELDEHVPDGYRTEIIGGKIVMSPWSKGYYFPVMRSLRRQLEPHLPEGHVVDSAPYLFTFPAAERAYGPDVFAAAEGAFRTERRHIDGEALSLAAELTSTSTRNADVHDKVTAYGKGTVPVYLLLDMQKSAATLFWQPTDEGYAAQTTVPFGEKLRVPAPFDCDLDTSEFLPAE
ncbi:Uma2 family endonuclease [Streptomyces sp. A7024]|uniref:Uma2 family endonuclease n=1 Tax=Streptomyces coryli TaxID=1128680 RepID=A0A6G4UEF1_9ACTN|nr:Uma2 family endonuclease [Streptomyces coryli]NGN69857.1 Uma2 family endonuclease [Streptomyces coryli]